MSIVFHRIFILRHHKKLIVGENTIDLVRARGVKS